jgi:hypothetical protein
MMLHRNAATAAASRASGQATNADFHRSVAVVIIALLLLAVLALLWINSERIDKTTIRQSDVQAVAEHWASEAGWSVIGVTARATGRWSTRPDRTPLPSPQTVSLQMVLVQQDVPCRERPGQTIRLSRGPAQPCAGQLLRLPVLRQVHTRHVRLSLLIAPDARPPPYA